MRRIIQFGSLGILLFIAAAWFNSTRAGSATVEPSAVDAIPVEVVAEHGVGDGHPATEVPIGDVTGIAVGTAGEFYFVDAEHHRVRKVGADGIATTVLNAFELGVNTSGASGPTAVAVDERRGVVYVADYPNNRVWVIEHGVPRPFAGTGRQGFGGDGGAATSAELNWPRDVALAPDGTVYIADSVNHRIRAVSADGTIRTVAGDRPIAEPLDLDSKALLYPFGVAAATGGTVYVADRRGGRLHALRPDGTLEGVRSPRGLVSGIATAANGDLFAAASGSIWRLHNGLWKELEVSEQGLSFTAIGVGRDGRLLAFAHRRNTLYEVTDQGTALRPVAGNGTRAAFGDGGPVNGASFGCHDLVVTGEGRILFSDTLNHRLVLATASTTRTLRG